MAVVAAATTDIVASMYWALHRVLNIEYLQVCWEAYKMLSFLFYGCGN